MPAAGPAASPQPGLPGNLPTRLQPQGSPPHSPGSMRSLPCGCCGGHPGPKEEVCVPLRASKGICVLVGVVRKDEGRKWSQKYVPRCRQLRASGHDGSGAEGGVHLDWAHTPGRCPLQVPLQSLVPEGGRGGCVGRRVWQVSGREGRAITRGRGDYWHLTHE